MSESEAVSHRDCSLGQWLYPSGLERFGHFAEMQKLEPVHERLHKTIKEIVGLKNDGEIERAEALYGDIEAISDQIVGLITELERQVA